MFPFDDVIMFWKNFAVLWYVPHCISGADYSFPMDTIENGLLVGSYSGILVGDIALVPGKVNKALFTNGIDQWVNIGNHRDKCLGDLTRCTEGFVMALWLKPHLHDGKEFYVNSGGHSVHSVGMSLHCLNGDFITRFKNGTTAWRIRISDIVSDVWMHVVLTWTRHASARIYLNGCLSGQHMGIPEIGSHGYNDFVFGHRNNFLGKNTHTAEMILDEVRVWDADMDEESVWEIYAADVQELGA